MLAEDMTVFFSTDEHAVSAIWRPTVGSVEMVSVIFDTPDDDLLSGVVQSRAYEITYPASSFVGLAAGETVEIETVIYKVLGTPDAIEDGKIMRAALYKP